MRHFLVYISVMAVVATTVLGCNKETSLISDEENQVVNISFRAQAQEPLTKSVFGEKEGTSYPVIWTTDKSVMIFGNMESGTKYSLNSEVTIQDEGKTAVFDLSWPYDLGNNCYFTAISPSNANVNSLTDTRINIIRNQTPSDASVDQNVHIMAAKSSVYNYSSLPESIPLSFTHAVAYGKFSLKNFPEDVVIKNIEIQAPLPITGTFTYDFDGQSLSKTDDVFNSLVIYPSDLTATSNSAKVFWFALNPVNLEGKTVKFSINTENGVFVKNITFPSGTGNFQRAHIASFSLNMSGVEIQDANYVRINNISELTAGSRVIIAGIDADFKMIALGASKRPKYNNNRAGVDVEITGTTIKNPSEEAQFFEIAPGIQANSIMFRCLNGAFSGLYIGPASNGYLNAFSSSSQEYTNGNTSFTISFGQYPNPNIDYAYTLIKSVTTQAISDNKVYIGSWGTTEHFFYMVKKDYQGWNRVNIYKLSESGS